MLADGHGLQVGQLAAAAVLARPAAPAGPARPGDGLRASSSAAAGPSVRRVLDLVDEHAAVGVLYTCSGLAVQIVETPTRYAIEWNASYRFENDAFIVADGSGMRAILGYPVADLQAAERHATRQI